MKTQILGFFLFLMNEKATGKEQGNVMILLSSFGLCAENGHYFGCEYDRVSLRVY